MLQCLRTTVLPGLLVVAFFVGVNGGLIISLKNKLNDSITYDDYRDDFVYNMRVSFQGGLDMSGYLHRPEPWHACVPVRRVKSSSNGMVSWMAVLHYRRNCFKVAVWNLQRAGYKLIIIADGADIRSSEFHAYYKFPIVKLPKSYINYLIETSLSDFNNPVVEVSVHSHFSDAIIFFVELALGIAGIIILCSFSMCIMIVWELIRAALGCSSEPKNVSIFNQRTHERKSSCQINKRSLVRASSTATVPLKEKHTERDCTIHKEVVQTDADQEVDPPSGHFVCKGVKDRVETEKKHTERNCTIHKEFVQTDADQVVEPSSGHFVCKGVGDRVETESMGNKDIEISL